MRKGERIVLMTPDSERGLTGVVMTAARVVDGERIVTVCLDNAPRFAVHYPAQFVAAA